MKVIYIAGKFRGKTAWDITRNVNAAEEMAFKVANLGAMPLCPHMNTRNFDGTLTDQFWLDGTLELMKRCDAVFLVPGYEDSPGSLNEMEEAFHLGIPIFNLDQYFDLKDFINKPTKKE